MVDNIELIEDEEEVITSEAEEEAEARREKRRASRKRSLVTDDETKNKIVESVLKRMNQDMDDRQEWMDDYTLRYAKYRGILMAKDWPWEGAANTHVPIMQQDSLRVQDTMHNAVMANRPPVQASSRQSKDVDKEDNVDKLIDFQLFSEQPGENQIGSIIQKFTEDGLFTSYIPWVKDTRKYVDVQVLPRLEDEFDDGEQLAEIVEGQLFDDFVSSERTDEDGYEYKAVFNDSDGEEQDAEIKFYFQEGGKVEAHITRPVDLHNGPVVIVKAIEDVVHPFRCGNLQIPGPANPHGAPHVFFLDYPQVDEIARLKESGFYDLLDDDGMKKIKEMRTVLPSADQNQEPKTQKDEIEGTTPNQTESDRGNITRIMAFDHWDIDGDGLEEDVIFRIAKESKQLLRVSYLTEEFPAFPPRRPTAEATFLPVDVDRRYGISLLELSEFMQDVIVTAFNQAIDNGTLANTPFFGYRPASQLKPNTMRISPMEGIPLNDPANDLKFFNIPNNDQGIFFNIIALATQFNEKTSMEGELNFGRVPQGKASALRNFSTVNALLQQSEARPERILRRLFMGLTEIFAQIHELNQFFLPDEKEIRITGVPKEGEEPFLTIKSRDDIKGRFAFEFKASLLNTSSSLLQAGLNDLTTMLLTPLAFQLGLVDSDKAYNLIADRVKAYKLDADRYVKRPTPKAGMPSMNAEDVILSIMEGELPDVQPLEGPQRHLDRIQEVIQVFAEDRGIVLDEIQQALLNQHIRRMFELMREEAEQAQLQASAQQFQNGQGQGAATEGEVPTGGAGGNPQVGGGELIAEDLPGSGGGANQGVS